MKDIKIRCAACGAERSKETTECPNPKCTDLRPDYGDYCSYCEAHGFCSCNDY